MHSWTARDDLAHLAATEAYHHACLDGRVTELMNELGERGATDIATFNAIGIADLDALPNDELLPTWTRADAKTRQGFRARGDGEVDTSVGLYPARWQAFHLAGELATHADDIAVPIPDADREARRDWRARFSRFALRRANRIHRGSRRPAACGRAANLFFQLVSSRYERASVIVTSNKPFGRWGETFGDATVAAAMIDRLVHHAEVVAMKGDSYRLKDRDLGRVPTDDAA